MKITENKIITFAILFIWGVLIVFGVLTITQPSWLVELSNPGKNIEAITIKNSGDNYLKDNEYYKAIDQYKKALTLVPDLKGAIANLGISYNKSGQYSKAILVFNQLLKMEPEFPGIIYFNLASIYEKTNDQKQAINNYIKAADNLANPENAYQKAGRLYMKQKDWQKAISCFKKAISYKRNIENAYKSMLIVQKLSTNDTTPEYKTINNEIITQNYTEYLPNYDASIFNTLLSNDKNLAKTYNNLGYCLALQEKYMESKPYLEIAIKIDPGYTDAINNLKTVENFISMEE